MSKYKYKLKETSITGGESAFNTGQGAQYSTPYAYKKKAKNYYIKKLGYKLVNPKKLASQSKGIDTKYLWRENNMYKYKLSKKLNEADPTRIKFQEERIAAFKQIEEKLNNLYPLLDNAKEETIAYYNETPESYSVVISTNLILDYLNDIEKLLNPEQ
jgi:hypothetical protein